MITLTHHKMSGFAIIGTLCVPVLVLVILLASPAGGVSAQNAATQAEQPAFAPGQATIQLRPSVRSLGMDTALSTTVQGTMNYHGAAVLPLSASENGSWEHFTTTNSPLTHDLVTDLDLDQEGNVWMATYGGGVNVRYRDGSWQSYTTMNSGLAENRVYILTILDDGRKWFGTDSGGASVLNPGGTWFTYQTSNGLASNWILDVQKDNDGSLWFSNWYEGLSVLSLDTTWQYYNIHNSWLANNDVYAILLDNNGDKWFATYGGGVSVLRSSGIWQTYNTYNSGLTHNDVYTIARENNNTLWFGTLGGGVSVLNPDGSWRSYTPSNSGLASYAVHSIVKDKSGNWWFGTDNGVSVLKPDNSWNTFNSSNSGLNNNDVRSMIFDSDNNLWLATYGGGLNVYHNTGDYYVKSVTSGTGDCSSWANACTLQTALTSAISGQEIWVSAGTYKPTTEADRAATFQLKSGVTLYGGFVGTETTRDQRNPAINVTTLSGDLNGDDVGFTNNSENVYHVVTGASNATLNGFTITAGNANGSGLSSFGGGMYNYYYSSPALANITFSGNSANDYGGGMSNYFYSSPTLTNVTFSGNSANDSGGGMYNYSYSSPPLTNVTFSGNSAVFGGGMYNNDHSSPILTNVTFNGNSANDSGGGMSNYDYSSPTLTNVTFSGNSATSYGGGMYNYYYSSNPEIRNTILWGNTASDGGAQIYNKDGQTPVVSYSVLQGGCPAGSICTNIITTDPKLGTLGNHGGFTQTISLQAGSSAIDTGNDATCPATDQRGVSRPQGAHCDIGAYELDTTAPIVDSITRHNPSLTNLASVNFTVTFSESVTGVNGSDFSLTTAGVSGAYVSGVSGSGSVYTVTVNSGAGSGTIRLDVTDDDSIVDMAGNPLGGTGADNGNYTGSETYTIDKTAPAVVSSLRANPSPTNLASVDFTVTFSESVTGVDVSDFSLTTTGVSGASVTGVSGSGSVYTVTVNTGSGNGTIRLDVPASATIIDLAGNPLSSLPYTGGEAYIITKVFTIFLPLILR